MVSFNQIPGNILVPFFYAEVNSGGTPYEGSSRLLLLGQKVAAGMAPAGVPVIIQSETDAAGLFGVGSMLYWMYKRARATAPVQPIWALPLADPDGAKAAGTITISTAPASTGAGILRVLGQRLSVQVYGSDTVAAVASTIAAAINGAGLAVTAAAAAGVVTVTARHAGLASNGLDLTLVTDEPNVLTATNTTIVALSGGAGAPDLADAFAGLGDDEFDWICGPYADAAALNAVRDLMVTRWGPTVQLYGHYFTINYGTLAANVTLGNSRNDAHASIMASQVSPTPPWEFAAGLGAMAAAHLTDAPELSRPLHTLVLPGLLPPDSRAVWWDIDDRQALYTDGMSAYKVTVDGQVAIDRVITTYQQTALGVTDRTFMSINTMAQSMFFVRYMRTEVSNTHGRQALADENPYGLDEICTPDDIRTTLIHAYQGLQALGVVEKADLFAEYLVVERDSNNADRVNAFLPPDVVNQLNVFAANATINLQYAA